MIFTQDLHRLIGWGSSIVDKVVDPLLPGDQFSFPRSLILVVSDDVA
jgi:hypothetical protein